MWIESLEQNAAVRVGLGNVSDHAVVVTVTLVLTWCGIGRKQSWGMERGS